VFDELPKTSTGKIQKFKLREMAKAAGTAGQATEAGGRKIA
jgi:acyl-coenzyme A synthetase/AMP-(fatty) acid ligase